jgi:hypothetical protein
MVNSKNNLNLKIMKNEIKQIECPKCKTVIDVNDILYNQLEEQVKQEYGAKFATLETEKAGIALAIEEGVNTQLAVKKTELEKKIKAQLKAETSDEILSYQTQLEEKTMEVKQMNLLKSELAESKRKFNGLKEQIEADSQEKFNQLLDEEKIKIRNLVEKNMKLKFSEKDQVIESMKGQISEMQRKIEQGSMQIQGEAQELLIEDFLKVSFPLDSIIEVKKGSRGADCTQIRRNPLFFKAASMRCWLSFTALSGKPTKKKLTPALTLTSTVIVVASIPVTALP